MPLRGLVQTDYINAMDAHNRHVTEEDAALMVRDAIKENKAESSGFLCCSSEGTGGTQELRSVFEQNMDSFEPGARTLISGFLRGERVGGMIPVREDGPADRVGKKLISRHADRTTWNCDWFPMTLRPAIPQSSLFSPGGVCDKYDRATGKASRAHELANHQTTGIAWSGHCDMASRVCALLNQPSKNVTYNGVVFTPHDIQGLLVMVSNDIAGASEPFLGARNNGNAGDDPAEPYPHVLMPEMIKHFKDGRVIVLDIDNGPQVWNYAFDNADIREFDTPQDGMRKVSPMNGGKIRYQTWNLSGTGYDAEIRHYKSWVEYDSEGTKLSSGWFGDPRDTKRNPDFMWVPTPCGDLTRKSSWPSECAYNPQIDPRVVYDIYSQSL